MVGQRAASSGITKGPRRLDYSTSQDRIVGAAGWKKWVRFAKCPALSYPQERSELQTAMPVCDGHGKPIILLLSERASNNNRALHPFQSRLP
jgi:hypothetical protein